MGSAGFNEAAVASSRCRRIQPSGHIDRAHHHVPHQQNAASHVFQGARFNDARVIDRGAAQCIESLGRQNHLAAIGLYQLFVFSQRTDGTLVNTVAQQTAVVQAQGDLAARSQQGFAQRGADDAFIARLRGQQGNVAAGCRGECALVDDRAGAAGIFGKHMLASHEVGVAHA